jgi:hypothetical protein
MKIKITRKVKNRKYYLHKKVKKIAGLKLNVRMRELTADDNLLLDHKYAIALGNEYGYNRQISIR